MKVVLPESPPPRLLSTAVLDYTEATYQADGNGKLRRGNSWRGNGFAIFAGLAIGGLMVCGVSTFVLTRHTVTEQVAPARLVPTGSTPPPVVMKPLEPTETTPNPYADINVPLDAIRITSISLGHPRLAVINRQALTEGDWLYLNVGSSPTRIRLRVIRIADGQVQLTLGKRVLTVPLQQLKLKPAR